ncbi:MAG: hypothetical protein AB9M60_02515 [Leptothrix sp. (in: b-proteobacteria)]
MSTSLLSTFTQFVFRTLMLVAAAVFMASVLAAGLLVAVLHVLANLLRGQRPGRPTFFMGPLRHMQRRGFGGRAAMPQRSASAAGQPADAVVVEGQARELR